MYPSYLARGYQGEEEYTLDLGRKNYCLKCQQVQDLKFKFGGQLLFQNLASSNLNILSNPATQTSWFSSYLNQNLFYQVKLSTSSWMLDRIYRLMIVLISRLY